MSKSESFFRDVVTLTSVPLVSQILGILLTPILTRLYTPAVFGLVALFSLIIVIPAVFATEEKPENPKSNYAITGLYMFSNDVCQVAKTLTVSSRGELEIVDVIKHYLAKEELKLETLGRGIAWLDTGTHESLLDASNFIEVLENRQGLKISCVEEIAHQKGWISDAQLESIAKSLKKNTYGEYLMSLLNN